ncbi:aromatic ring-hydroxylating dioxygenase subunit alpha [Emcibacter sp. SYSU 3D8]|uniref:aromatic ring-hydroxylating dioxygenase subunit alpha n=1 Tax=Emcibacter sp. SYSU 3D8 TaxID=3133969 RepID=UPI0031FE4574
MAQDRHSLAARDTPDLRKVDSHPDHWYPLAWSNELAAGKTLGRRLMGEPVVLYRGASGTVFALEDRCAHRQVPLSVGVVDGDVLQCGYHGWAYDCSGKCVDVPYFGMDKLPNGVCAYPAREIDGLIFVFPGDPALADQQAPAALGSATNRRYKTRKLNREVACHYTFMHENLFDMNHQFLHRRNMGTIKAKCLDRRSGDDWCEVDYTFSRTEGRASLGETVIVDLVRAKGDKKDFGDLMTIRTQYPYQRLKVWVGRELGGDRDPVLDVWLAYTPLDKEQRTNRTFGYLSVMKPPVPGLIHVAWPFVTWFTERIFAEDKAIVELEQAAHDAQGTDWNNEVFPAIRDLRELLARQGRPGERANRPAAAE